ncbi:hypothetical protein BCR34DRAFT_583127 [Clohesyomyces aquaticus]|uniref:Uncharacterized protein n=1 Tax=Clohesyomyces aquaticus TaxID=1231657 RepID=A0A1Y2A6V7_9PLEO|nr:hypothetical protein BCR34DRAFT_583127 [Clohesyomyces aquaticus]
MFQVDDRPRSASDLASLSLPVRSVQRLNTDSNAILTTLHDAKSTTRSETTQSCSPTEDIPKQNTQSSVSSPQSTPKNRPDVPQETSKSINHGGSTNTLESMPDTSILEKWVQHGPNIANCRMLILTARINLIKERHMCVQFEALVDSIMDRIVALRDAATTVETLASCIDDLVRLSKRLKDARESLKEQRRKTTDLEDQLSSQEYILTELEKQVYQNVDKELQTRLDMENSTHSDARESAIADSRSTIRKQQSPVEELYSRMGDLRIHLDRLSDFEADLRAEMDERDLLRAAGRLDISTDDEFFQQRKLERSQIQAELERAQVDVKHLKELCRSQGLEFEDVQFPNPLDEIYTETLFTTSAAPSSKILDNYEDRRERVNVWLTDPSKADEPQPLSTDPEVNISGPESDLRSEPESRLDCRDSDWVLARRPSSSIGMPAWKLGPPPGSALLKALLLESSSEGPMKHVRNQASHSSL